MYTTALANMERGLRGVGMMMPTKDPIPPSHAIYMRFESERIICRYWHQYIYEWRMPVQTTLNAMPCDVLIDAKMIVAYVNASRGDTITFEPITNEHDVVTCVKIRIGSGVATFNAMGEPHEYPIPGYYAATRLIGTCNTTILNDAIERIWYAMATDDLRPALHTMATLWHDNTLYGAITTDGYRLACYRDAWVRDDPETWQMYLIPRNVVKTLNAVAHAYDDGTLTFEGHDHGGDINTITIKYDTWAITYPVPSSLYPNVQRLIPKEYRTTIVCDVAKLMQALRQLKPFVHKDAPHIMIRTDHQWNDIRLESMIASSHGDGNHAMVSVMANVDSIWNEDALIINVDFLIDALKTCRATKTVTLRFAMSDHHPMVIEHDDEMYGIIMPVYMPTHKS